MESTRNLGNLIGYLFLLVLAALLAAAFAIAIRYTNESRVQYSSKSDSSGVGDPQRGLKEFLEDLDDATDNADVYKTPDLWERLMELQGFTSRIIPDQITGELLSKLEGLAEDIDDGIILTEEELNHYLDPIESENPDKFRPKTEDDIR